MLLDVMLQEMRWNSIVSRLIKTEVESNKDLLRHRTAQPNYSLSLAEMFYITL